MKKVFLLVLCSFFCLNVLTAQKSAEKANKTTALRCLKLAENCLIGNEWNNAYNQAVLGLSYDENISDLIYVKAASQLHLNYTKASVIADLYTAFEKDNWVGYSKNPARIFLADLLCDTGKYEESLKILDEPNVIYSADAEVIRVKNLYRMGTDESWNNARLKINSARRIYANDDRFTQIFLVFETLRKSYCELYNIKYEIPEIVRTINSAYLQKLPEYNKNQIDNEVMSAYLADYDVMERIIKAIDSKAKSVTPLFVIACLDIKLYSDEKAFDLFFSSMNNSIDILLLESFLAKITDENVKQKTAEKLSDFDGVILIDENLDIQNEIAVTYKSGRPYYFSYDYNCDGIFEYSVACDFGVPKTVNAANDSLVLNYEIFPDLESLKVVNSEIIYNFAHKDLSLVPFEMAKDPFAEKIGVELFIPYKFKNTDGLITDSISDKARSIELPVSERNDSKVVYSCENGNIVEANFYEEEKLYGYCNFSESNFINRFIDTNFDGNFDRVETYLSDEGLNLPEDNQKMLDKVFAGLVSDFYLSKISIDSNSNTIMEFVEEYLPGNGKIIYWDFDDDGILNSKFIQYPVVDGEKKEEAVYYNSKGDLYVSLIVINDNPVKMILEDHEALVFVGKNSNIYWIDQEPAAVLEEKIIPYCSNGMEHGNIQIFQFDEGRVSVIRVGKNFYCRVIPE